MKKLILLLSLFSLTQTNAQQNLVLNPSFEDTTGPLNCNYYLPWVNFPVLNWQSENNSPIDLLSMNLSTNCEMYPLWTFANQSPRTGNNYIGLRNEFIYAEEKRNHIRGNLLQNLTIGVTYTVEFYVCLGNMANYAMNNFGVKFINSSQPITQNPFPIILQPDVNYSGPPITDKDNWTLMSFQFTPTVANLNAFVIGNFFVTNDTNFLFLGNPQGTQASYLLDDVAVYVSILKFDLPDVICEGDTLVLPEASLNGITGTWSPAPNNQQTTTYTFVPFDTNYSTTQVTIVVKPNVIPEFDEIGPFCDEVANISSLPTTSNNGVEGTWSPVFNPNQTNTYTFTPNDTQCNAIITKTIIIERTPTFDIIEPFCDVDLNFSLPTVSTNGISGTWSPEFDPYNSQTYSFTSDSGYCSDNVTLDVVVFPQLKFDFNYYCKNDEFFVEIIPNNFSFSEITNIQWLINNSSISETGNKINLSDYSHLLQEVNTIEIIFTDSNDCLHTKEIQVLGKNFCKIQKGISPNGDGLNEYFDLVSFGGVDLKIFNRYGGVVYEKSNYKNEWNGQSKTGKQLPSGTYFYQIQTNIGEQFTGYIQLSN